MIELKREELRALIRLYKESIAHSALQIKDQDDTGIFTMYNKKIDKAFEKLIEYTNELNIIL